MKRLGVTYLRTGLSWADWFRPDAERWFDRLVRTLEPFDTTVTFCFTPDHLGIEPHHTSPPREPEFVRGVLRRDGSPLYWAGCSEADCGVKRDSVLLRWRKKSGTQRRMRGRRGETMELFPASVLPATLLPFTGEGRDRIST